jgi:lipoyl synthase
VNGGLATAPGARRKPAWLKIKAPEPQVYRATGALLDGLKLHTVCTAARCPNKGECYASGTATFLILGDACTRDCRFCAVDGVSAALRTGDPGEPRRVAAAASRLGLRHVVVTSVTRDDLPDGGAGHFAATVAAVRDELPDATVEVLIPDLGGDEAALRAVLDARPDVLGHNLETVPRLYAEVRPGARYTRSLELLSRAVTWARAVAPAAPVRPLVKTGFMVGLGEREDEIATALADCANVGVDLVTIGQYLQPQRDCLPVARYVQPEEFSRYERRGADLGLSLIAAPFVRSSYRAGELTACARRGLSPVAATIHTRFTSTEAVDEAAPGDIGRRSHKA